MISYQFHVPFMETFQWHEQKASVDLIMIRNHFHNSSDHFTKEYPPTIFSSYLCNKIPGPPSTSPDHALDWFRPVCDNCASSANTSTASTARGNASAYSFASFAGTNFDNGSFVVILHLACLREILGAIRERDKVTELDECCHRPTNLKATSQAGTIPLRRILMSLTNVIVLPE